MLYIFLHVCSGPEEMEDASEAIAEAREAEDPDDMSEQHSIVMRESAIYNPAPIPASSQNVSLMGENSRRASVVNLNDAGNPDSSTAELMAHTDTIENVLTRESEYSRDSGDSADSTRPLSEVPSEAPPDYETELGHTSIHAPPGLSDASEPSPHLSSTEGSSAFTQASQASTTTSNSTPNRRSVFRGFNLFNIGSSSSEANSSAQPPIPTATAPQEPQEPQEPRSSNLSTSTPTGRTSTATSTLR